MKQSFKVHLMQHNSNVLNTDTLWVKKNKQLPSFYDYSHSQLSIEWLRFGTDNRRNPLKGMDWSYRVSTGLKKIKKQFEILAMKYDAEGKVFDYNQLYQTVPLTTVQSNMQLNVNQFNKMAKQSTFKLGLQAGWLYGKKLFLNELYQIGGIKTLRGFDEESIFPSSYLIGTTEFRYLLDQGSNIFGFMDGALVQRNISGLSKTGNYFGIGTGINLLTKSGIFTMVFALGKSDQQPLSFQRSKIHIGFSTFF